MALRPLAYSLLTMAVLVYIGFDSRPVRRAYDANRVAILSVVLYGLVFLTAVFLFGASVNAMAPSPSVITRNLWERGSIVVFSELIRYKLIKSSNQARTGIVIALTIVLAYGHMNALRLLVYTDAAASTVFFETIFTSLIISIVASYIAVNGSLLSVILVSFVYSMTLYLVPIVPNLRPLVWALITSSLLLITAIIYNFIINEKSRETKTQAKRAVKYAKKPILGYLLSIVLISVLVAFFNRAFPLYPVVILTSSMSGTFERGSLVFNEKVPSGEAFSNVSEGDVIHFICRGRVEYVHRVVSFKNDSSGERQYITRGDASELTDPFPVQQDSVLGIARASLPFFGYPYIFFHAIFRAIT